MVNTIQRLIIRLIGVNDKSIPDPKVIRDDDGYILEIKTASQILKGDDDKHKKLGVK